MRPALLLLISEAKRSLQGPTRPLGPSGAGGEVVALEVGGGVEVEGEQGGDGGHRSPRPRPL